MAVATQIPENVFQHIAKNAGVIANAFDTSTGTLSRANIKGATKGGITFTDKPTYTDVGEDIDNMPLSAAARQVFKESPAALALYEFASLKDEKGKYLAESLRNTVMTEPQNIDFDSDILELIYSFLS